MAASTPRFDRVQAILTDVQGPDVPSYQGHGAFWLDHTTLLSVELYGQRMIAPPTDGSPARSGGGGCCGTSAGATDGAAAEPDADAPDQPGDATGLAHRAVAMFSPDENPDADCFPGGGGGDDPTDTTRSDRSGLIRGLRGQAPFDGSVFPPLLWDAARRATDSEIAEVAAWIDAGCPAADDATPPAASGAPPASVTPDRALALAHGDARHARADAPVNAHREAVGALKVRKDIACLTPEELRRYRAALVCLNEYDGYWLDERSYDYWARIHTNSCQHGWEQFLPWHRLYLYFFEQHLQDLDPYITLPYWSWSQYADQNDLRTTQLDTGVLPEAFRCWLDAPGVDALAATTGPDGAPLFSKAEIKRLKKLVGPENAKNSGRRFLQAVKIPYAVDTATGTPRWTAKVRAIYDELVRVNPLWFPDRWPGTVGGAAHYPTPADVAALLAIPTFPEFGGGPADDHYYGRLEETHNGMHNFSGGMNPDYAAGADEQALENPQVGYMTENRTTAFDPLFWSHHSNVDRLWARWQQLHPGVEPQALDGNLAPWPLAVRDALSTTALGYEYVKDVHAYPTDPRLAMVRFRSAETPVPPAVAPTFRAAEVRLHRVRRSGVENAYLRVFLNAPSADADTPTLGNPHFAGQVATFHTQCYGGPGHCADPPPRRGRHDLRPLHHHEPRNIRVDVTETAKALLAEGVGALSVHVVAVGLDGAPARDALYLDAVSLTFLD